MIALEIAEHELLAALANERLKKIHAMAAREAARDASVGRVVPGTDVLALLVNPSDKLARRAGVYFLVKDGHVIYIGQSVDVRQRVMSHAANGRQYDYALWHPCDEDDLSYFENLWTVRLKPRQCGRRNYRAAVNHMAAVVEYCENYDNDL